MGCNCGRKRQASDAAAAFEASLNREINPLDPPEWGPILWKYLHCLAERMGTSGSSMMDTDQANYMETLLTLLPQIVPCTECQGHATEYLAAHPVPPLKGLYGSTLRSTTRTWLFEFHQAVRIRKGQPLMLQQPEECEALYAHATIDKREYASVVQSVAAAIRQGWVRMDHWRKWYSHSERMRILSGSVIV